MCRFESIAARHIAACDFAWCFFCLYAGRLRCAMDALLFDFSVHMRPATAAVARIPLLCL